MHVLNKKLFMRLVKMVKKTLVERAFIIGFCSREERSGSTPNIVRKSEIYTQGVGEGACMKNSIRNL